MSVTRPTWLTVNSIDLATHAWEITDLSELLDTSGVRGGDEVMPGSHGLRPFPRWRTGRVITLPMVIYGQVDEDGAPIADPVTGAIEHVEYLATNLGHGNTVGDGTVPAVWTLPDASTRTADVTVLGLFGTRDVAPGVLRTTLDLSIPSGRFV